MPISKNFRASILSKIFVFAFILFPFEIMAGTEPAQAADACNIYEVRIVTTPSPPQWAPTYERFDALMANFPEKADVVMFGDSLAQLWPDKSLNAIFPDKAIGNLGVGGDLIQNSLWRLERMPVAKLSPQKILVMLGTNNLKSRSKPCAIAAGLTKTVEKMHEIWPEAVIYMLTIPPRGKIFNEFEAERQEVNSSIEAMPSRNDYVRVVTGFDDVITCGQRGTDQMQEWFPDYFPDTCPNYAKDRLHLAESGYAVLAGIFKQENN